MKRWLLSLASIGIVSLAGCSKEPAKNDKAADTKAKPAAATEDHHHGEGPNGGVVTDWGGGTYHVEFTVDHHKKSSAVYILGDDSKSPAPIKADKLTLSINEPAFQVELKAEPLDGEVEGTSSRFVGTHDNLGIVQEFAGTITGEVEGTPYAGDFKEEPHGH